MRIDVERIESRIKKKFKNVSEFLDLAGISRQRWHHIKRSMNPESFDFQPEKYRIRIDFIAKVCEILSFTPSDIFIEDTIKYDA